MNHYRMHRPICDVWYTLWAGLTFGTHNEFHHRPTNPQSRYQTLVKSSNTVVTRYVHVCPQKKQKNQRMLRVILVSTDEIL